MRKTDKKNNFKKVNALVEQRYLASKGIINESFHEPDATPIGVDGMHGPVSEDNGMGLSLNKGDYASQLYSMEKPYYKDLEALSEIIKIYQTHIQALGFIMDRNSGKI